MPRSRAPWEPRLGRPHPHFGCWFDISGGRSVAERKIGGTVQANAGLIQAIAHGSSGDRMPGERQHLIVESPAVALQIAAQARVDHRAALVTADWSRRTGASLEDLRDMLNVLGLNSQRLATGVH
jgi:hypothetical protein